MLILILSYLIALHHADRNCLKALKASAYSRFKTGIAELTAVENPSADMFAQIVDTAYSSSLAVLKICKDLVTIAMTYPKIGVSSDTINSSFKAVMKKHSELAIDIAEAMQVRLKHQKEVQEEEKLQHKKLKEALEERLDEERLQHKKEVRKALKRRRIPPPA